jgi:hypothetical protein
MKKLSEMHPDTELGVYVELRFLLEAQGWTVERALERFRVKPPIGRARTGDFDRFLEDEVWRVARFVRYREFISIACNEDKTFTIFSRSDSGLWFEIVFERG